MSIDISPGVAPPDQEFLVNMANTMAFIAADPSVIVINRPTEISDGAGGKVTIDLVDAFPEIVRMIPQGADNATANPITQTTNGSLDRPDFVMLGEPGLTVKRGDFFEWRDLTWKILTIRQSPQYETKADVAVRKDA